MNCVWIFVNKFATNARIIFNYSNYIRAFVAIIFFKCRLRAEFITHVIEHFNGDFCFMKKNINPSFQFLILLIITLLPISNIHSQHLPKQENDWLIKPSIFKANVLKNTDQKEVVLTNGLIKRVFRIEPNCATVDYRNLITSEAIIRAIRPEAILWINEKKYKIGGLEGQIEQAYILPEWLNEMKSDPNAFQLKKQALKMDHCNAKNSKAAELNRWGETMFKESKTREAEADFHKAVKIDPQCSEALNNLGVLSWQNGRAEPAYAYFFRAYLLKPQDSNVRANLFDCCEAIGKHRIKKLLENQDIR